ncbi:unnamed protein product, partial [marine sediment metagenome]
RENKYCAFYEEEHAKNLEADVYFICVEEWNVEKVFETWRGVFLDKNPIVVIRSTTSPGTTEELRKKYNPVPIVHNPEFLRERDALHDFLYPDKIVIGRNLQIRDEVDPFFELLYKPFNAPIIFTDSTTSEFLKLASNAVLSSYISIWNQIKPVADKIGVNSHQVAKILTLDPRISKYGTIHGKPFGGFCLPKDLDSMIKLGKKLNVTTVLLDAVKAINDELTGDEVEENSSTKKAREEA